ncbi:MAG TPA: hypothetical protein VNO30_11140 [Kofleriaceae bacterium]|nr:hypothetical protein [Kofleriaceae bacterium]
MRRGLVFAITLGGAAALSSAFASSAFAHVAPSVDDNNRYLKLTPLGDRVRLAYVVFYGEVPGARLRPTLDTDGDGSISEREGQVFGAKLGTEIAAALDVSVDGVQQPIAWTAISVGMSTPRVAAGALSVDLVASLCLPSARGSHELRLFDRFRVPRPGETEVRIEDSPGVRIQRARVGDRADASGSFRFTGPGGPLSDDGLALSFTAGDQALVLTDGACGAGRGGRGVAGVRRGAAVAGALAILGAAAGAVVIVRRRRRRRRGRAIAAAAHSART